jgi:hypothetical protein
MIDLSKVDPEKLALAQRLLKQGVTVPPDVLAQQRMIGMPIGQFSSNYWYLEDGSVLHLRPHQIVKLEYAFNPLNCPPFGFQTIFNSTIKKSGKALALDTPIPTPTGWTIMGRLQVGDYVYNEKGWPCEVTFTTDVMHDHECYRVSFSDGTSIVADAEHLWEVESLPHYNKVVFNTEQLKTNLYRNDGARNYRISVAQPLDIDDKPLPIDPYVLGAWLGDGTSATGHITSCDPEILEYVAAHYEVKKRVYSNRAPTYIIGTNFGTGVYSSFTAQLALLGVLNNKYIPNDYLRAGYSQRLDLLQGLMDTDGWISSNGVECEFTSTLGKLADQVVELVRSLGMKCTIREGIATVNGKDCGLKYRVAFHATTDRPVFRLARKAARLNKVSTRTARSTNIHITSIESVPSVPVRCITVNSPSHLYLAGRGFTPTHNTEEAGLVCRWVNETWGGANQVYTVANDKEQNRGRIYGAIQRSMEKDPLYDKARKILKSKDGYDTWRIIERDLLHLPTGSIIRAIAGDHEGEAGSNPTLTAWTEIWALRLERDKRLWAELTPVNTRDRSIRYVETYAGYIGESAIEWDLWQQAVKFGKHLTIQDMPDWPFEPDDEEGHIPFYVNYDAQLFAHIDQGLKARRMPWQQGERGKIYYAAQAYALRNEPGQYDRLHNNYWVERATAFIPIQSFINNYDESLAPSIGEYGPGGFAEYVAQQRIPCIIGADGAVSGDCTAIVMVCRHPKYHSHTVPVYAKKWDPPPGGQMDYEHTIKADIQRLFL